MNGHGKSPLVITGFMGSGKTSTGKAVARRLGCDFIDMDTQEHRDTVLDEFKKALLLDHTHVSVNGFSSLGLVAGSAGSLSGWPCWSVSALRSGCAN